MSEKEIRVCRDMQLAIMGHVLISQYGEEALEILAKWQNEKTKKQWSEIARSLRRNDPEYLICLFNEDAHEFEVIRKNVKTLEVKVTKCIHADTFKKLNAAQIGERLICSGDIAVTDGFNPNIKFTRPKLLMVGDDCCHFKWELKERDKAKKR